MIPEQQFDNNGKPLAGGCLQTFQSGTTMPLGTFSDALGTVPNANPVQYDSAGRARIFLQAQAYTLKLYNHGATNNCATSLGPIVWSIDGINPSANSILASNNIWTGTNTWQAASIFNGSVTMNAGFISTGPNVLGGGGSMSGTFSGSPIFSGIPNFSGGFLATTGSFSGQITSTLATGTAPFVITSTTVVPNLNASSVNGCTFPVPCPIGSTTPNTGAFTTLSESGGMTFNGALMGTKVQGNSGIAQLSGTMSGVSGAAVCDDGNKNTTTTGCNAGFSQIQAVTYCAAGCTVTGTPCTTTGGSFDTCTNTISWPVNFANTNYSAHCDGITPIDGGNPTAGRVNLQIASKGTASVIVNTVTLGAATVHWTEIDCQGIHP
jgi:hypothetical protein